jgi:transposase-like protein
MTKQATPKARRYFEPAFRLQVAKMVSEQDISLNWVCKDMDLVPSSAVSLA